MFLPIEIKQLCNLKVPNLNPNDRYIISYSDIINDNIINLSKIANKYNEILESHDLNPWKYPSDEEINKVGLRGLYISNFFNYHYYYYFPSS